MWKQCRSCYRIFNSTQFHRRTKAKDGLQDRCKECNKAQRRLYYTTANGKKSGDSSGKRIYARNRKFIYEYLLKSACECGERNPATLEFDHDDPSQKLFNIGSKKARSMGLDKLKQEMDKCTIRCANCHRKRTAKQYGWYSWV